MTAFGHINNFCETGLKDNKGAIWNKYANSDLKTIWWLLVNAPSSSRTQSSALASAPSSSKLQHLLPGHERLRLPPRYQVTDPSVSIDSSEKPKKFHWQDKADKESFHRNFLTKKSWTYNNHYSGLHYLEFEYNYIHSWDAIHFLYRNYYLPETNIENY